MTVPAPSASPLCAARTTGRHSEPQTETIGACGAGAVLGGNANAGPGAGVPAHPSRPSASGVDLLPDAAVPGRHRLAERAPTSLLDFPAMVPNAMAGLFDEEAGPPEMDDAERCRRLAQLLAAERQTTLRRVRDAQLRRVTSRRDDAPDVGAALARLREGV